MIVDILIIAILGKNLYSGYKKGFFTGLIGLLGIILGFVLAAKYSSLIKDILINQLHFPPTVSSICAFLAILVAVVAISRQLAKIIKSLVDLITLGLLDTILGLLFGLIKGLLLSCLLIWLMMKVDKLFTLNILEGSMTSQYFIFMLDQYVTPFVQSVAPTDIWT